MDRCHRHPFSSSSLPTVCVPLPGCSVFPFRCWLFSQLFPPFSSSKNYGWSSIATTNPLPPSGLLAGLDIVASNAFAWGPMVCDYPATPKSKSSSSWGTLIGSLAGAAGFMFVGGISYMTTGNANPVDMLLSLGLGIPALLIIVLSSRYHQCYEPLLTSISFVNVWPKAKPWQINRHQRHRYDRYRADTTSSVISSASSPSSAPSSFPHHRYHAGRLLPQSKYQTN